MIFRMDFVSAHMGDTHFHFKGGDHHDGLSTRPCLKPEVTENKDPKIKYSNKTTDSYLVAYNCL